MYVHTIRKIVNVLLIKINYRKTSTGFSFHQQYLSLKYSRGKDKSI